MIQELPPPLVPASVVLRDFENMPLDVVRLRDSELAVRESPEAFRCAVLLWCVSWHQVPAASLPDDDILLAGYAGFGRAVREWDKHRSGALRGWVKCSDGRLYHPVVAEKAIEAQRRRYDHAWKTECARIKKAAARKNIRPVYPTFGEWLDSYILTGRKQWVGPGCVPGTSPGTSPECPAEIASNRTEQNRTEQRALEALTPTSVAILKNPEGVGRIVGALRGFGYQVNSESGEVQRLAHIEATHAEITEACTKAKGWIGRPKPIGWVLSRIEGRRADAVLPGEAQALAQVDPAIAARQAADRKLEDALIDARQLAAGGIITADERAKREREARAAHAAAVGGLEAAA